ncbi:MAG TPA: hypothetical protein VMG39_10310 [Pseudolabrys sp.]|nr:hypothetical protein [Pseudolabrys sp.]
MTMHSDLQVTDSEDIMFDKTMKIGGIIVVLLAIAGAALWYFAG